jgi:hypothetical protein
MSGRSLDGARTPLTSCLVAPASKPSSSLGLAETPQIQLNILWLLSTSCSRWLLVPAVIDNLVKGASGQAIQNMNLLFGLPEETALLQQALFP